MVPSISFSGRECRHADKIFAFPARTEFSVTTGNFKGLRKLSAACGKDFTLGVDLYDAEQTVPFGERLFAVPISCLWA
jgi:uncharacterized protein